MPASAVYDGIGRGYARQRQPDPRIAAQLTAALGDARAVLNVGTVAGSYEPSDRAVVAVESAAVMLVQRRPGAAPAVQGRAEALPIADRAFDAVLGVLTLHHGTDQAGGLAECVRVARGRVVLLTWDPAAEGFWLVRDYLPEFLALDRRQFPPRAALAAAFAAASKPGVRVAVTPVPIPRDRADGFLAAYWARPAAYLDPAVQAGISSFARVPHVAAGLARLRADLASGEREARYGRAIAADALDAGYRVVVAHVVSAPGATGHMGRLWYVARLTGDVCQRSSRDAPQPGAPAASRLPRVCAIRPRRRTTVRVMIVRAPGSWDRRPQRRATKRVLTA